MIITMSASASLGPRLSAPGPVPPEAARPLSAARSASVRTSSAARAALRAVSGRRAPGMATTVGERDEQPRQRDLGRLRRRAAAATCLSASRRASEAARRGPPKGECAMSVMPSSAQRSTSPPRSGPSSTRLSADLHGADRRELQRLVELAAVDVATVPTRATSRSETSRRQRPHRRGPRGARVGCVQQVGVDGQPVERGEARLAVRANRLGAAVGDPGPPSGASCRPWSRCGRRARRRCVGAPAPAAARCGRARRRRGRRRARCRTP